MDAEVRDGPVRMTATIRGRVQGVGFRVYAARRARSLGLSGWVANRSDGSVLCVIEGDRDAVSELAGVLRDGPPGSYVTAMDESWAPATGGFDGFDIRAGGHPGD